MAVSIQWTGLLDWTIGLDYWTVFAYAHCATMWHEMHTIVVVHVCIVASSLENGLDCR